MEKVLYCSDNKVQIYNLGKEGSDGLGNHPWAVLLVSTRRVSRIDPKLKDIEHDAVLAWCSTRDEARKVAKKAHEAIGLNR